MHTVLSLCLTTILLLAATATGAFIDDGQFSLDIPDDWYTMSTVVLYERGFIASPWPLTADQVLESEDTGSGALLMVVVGLTPAWLQEDTLFQAVSMVEQTYRTYAENNGETFHIVAEPQAIQFHDRPAVVFTMQTGDTTRHTLLAERDGYLFRIETSLAAANRDAYETVMADIVNTLHIKGEPDVPPLQSYTTNVAELSLPPNWHVKHHERHQSFVSREKVEHADDIFYTGVTMFAIPNYAATYGVPASLPNAMYDRWLSVALQLLEQNDPAGIALDVWLAPVDGIESMFIESVSPDADGLNIHTLQVTTVKDNHFFVAIFEAPVDEFYEFRPLYRQSIDTMRWIVPQ